MDKQSVMNDLEHTYQENYLVIDNQKAKTNCCLLIFSSNGLKIEKGFEYLNICSSKRIKNYFKRIIFVRDLGYCFYVNGINDEVNTVSKMLSFFGQLTENYRVYTCGYSSGGYMALLFGIFQKNVDRVYSLGGVLNVLDWHGSFNNYNFSDLDVVKKATEEQKQFFDLRPFLKDVKCKCYFVYAGNAKADKPMIEAVRVEKNSNLFLVTFNTSGHGDYNWSYDFKYLFTFNDCKLDKTFNNLSKNVNCSRLKFSLTLQGPVFYLLNRIDQMGTALIRRCNRIIRNHS